MRFLTWITVHLDARVELAERVGVILAKIDARDASDLGPTCFGETIGE
jgi:hypothetical protein